MKEQIDTIPVNEAFETGGECPFCYLERQAEQRAIRYTIGPGASYMEPDVRAVTDRQGFCRAHYAEIVFDTGCDRCLTKVPTTLALTFAREVASPDTALDSSIEEGDREDEVDYFMEGYQLNVETFVYNEILLNWPMKILCMDDCKGICSVCGKNLNHGDCGCDRFVPDPRMAGIKDIFNAFKEV